MYAVEISCKKIIAMKNLWINVLLLLLAATFSACGGGGGGGRGMIQVVEATFYFNFYEKSCPHAEKIVKEVVLSQFKFNQGIAPGLLRLFFHDCFVEVKYLGTKLQLLQLYSYFGIRAQIATSSRESSTIVVVVTISLELLNFELALCCRDVMLPCFWTQLKTTQHPRRLQD